MKRNCKKNKKAHVLAVVLAFVTFFTAVFPVSAKTENNKTSIFEYVKVAFAGGSDVNVEAVEDYSVVFPVSEEREPRKKIKVVVTAYSSSVDETDSTPCITANGHDLCKHYETYGYGNTVAANFLPFGTTVRLPGVYGDKEFKVRDRMNARYGYGRIDIWLPTKAEAKKFGVKRIEMEVF